MSGIPGGIKLSKLSGLSKLKQLTFSGCLGITDNGLDSLQDLISLKYLDLSNCPGLTRKRIAKLEAALPDFYVIRDCRVPDAEGDKA